MKNKLILKMLSLLLGLSFITSCSDEFLDTPSENQYSISDLSDTDKLVETLYYQPWFTFNDKFLIATGDMYAGNMFSFDGAYSQFKDAQVTPQNPILREGYVSLFSVIDQANNIMDILKDFQDKIPADDYNRAIATARFMRANAYFYLVRTFGAVPIVDRIGSEGLPRRNRIEDVYKFIKIDLQFAIDNLPATSLKKGYANKFVSKGILAKVHLSLNEYSECATLCQEVINSGQYSLIQNYGKLFNDPESNNSEESLFALQWIAQPNSWGTQNTNQAYIVPAGTGITGGGDGWGVYLPSISLRNDFENGDLRKKFTIMSDGDFYPELKETDGGFLYKKILSATATNFRKYIVGSALERPNVYFMRTSQNTIILRYSDILLMLAEAKLAGGSSTSDILALDAYNEVRIRAGLPTKTVLTRAELFKERRVEFALEGQYFFDLKRRGIAEATAVISQQEVGFYSDDARTMLVSRMITPLPTYFTLPLPQSALDANPALSEEPVPFNFN